MPESSNNPELDPVAALAQMFIDLIPTEKQTVVSMRQLKSSLPDIFKENMFQQDAWEFGKIYLNHLIENMPTAEKRKELINLYQGKTTSVITCKSCANETRLKEDFCELLVNFEDKQQSKLRNYPVSVYQTTYSSLKGASTD